jgi:predicted nucleic acid-binding protein
LLMTEKNNEIIYLDTFVFMDMLSGQKEHVVKAKKYIGKKAIVSSVILTELTYHLLRHGAKEKTDEIIFYVKSLPNLTIIDVSNEIAEIAGQIRVRYRRKLNKKLTYFDSIHLATALVNNAKKFVTGDRGFIGIREIEIEVY